MRQASNVTVTRCASGCKCSTLLSAQCVVLSPQVKLISKCLKVVRAGETFIHLLYIQYISYYIVFIIYKVVCKYMYCVVL